MDRGARVGIWVLFVLGGLGLFAASLVIPQDDQARQPLLTIAVILAVTGVCLLLVEGAVIGRHRLRRQQAHGSADEDIDLALASLEINIGRYNDAAAYLADTLRFMRHHFDEPIVAARRVVASHWHSAVDNFDRQVLPLGPDQRLAHQAALRRARDVIRGLAGKEAAEDSADRNVKAYAGVAEARGEAPSPTVEMTIPSTADGIRMHGSVSAMVIPGPGSPSLHQLSYETQGRRHHKVADWRRRPMAIRFSVPVDRIVREHELPVEISSGNGRLVVEKFYSEGVVIDEDGTVGDPVGLVGYFADDNGWPNG